MKKKRWRLILQLGNLVLLVLILGLYTVYAVQNEQPPVYGWVADTPVERAARFIGPALWMQHRKVSDQYRDRPLTDAEAKRAEGIQRRMARIVPSHVVVRSDGAIVYGKLSEHRGPDGLPFYLVNEFDGRAFKQHRLVPSDLRRQAELGISEEPLAPRDWRFLLDHEELGNPYFLAPYVFVSAGDFATVHEVYLTLSLLQDQMVRTFRPLMADTELAEHVHVWLAADHHSYVEAARSGDSVELVNSIGFFRRNGRQLYLFLRDRNPHLSPTRGDEARSGQVDSRAVRHEGAHLLSLVLNILDDEQRVPFWLEEGLAQYFETPTPGALDIARIGLLQQALRDGELVPWQELLALSRVEEAESSSGSVGLAYAQAWWFFRHAMSPRHRHGFLNYLAIRQTQQVPTEPEGHEIFLMNILRTTASKFHAELEEELETVRTEESGFADLP